MHTVCASVELVRIWLLFQQSPFFNFSTHQWNKVSLVPFFTAHLYNGCKRLELGKIFLLLLAFTIFSFYNFNATGDIFLHGTKLDSFARKV